MSKLKSIENVNQDIRTHKDKIDTLREILGAAKERAKLTGSVNECSINKICSAANVSKLYLHGSRLQDGNVYKEEYLKIKFDIIEFRKNFKLGKELSNDKKTIIELNSKYESLLNSINPLQKELNDRRRESKLSSDAAKNYSDSKTQLLSKINQLEHELTDKTIHSSATERINNRVKRSIVSSGKHKNIKGKLFLQKIEQDAWVKSYRELNNLLKRSLSMRLYILVGLPCSGKTTWAENCDLATDRVPVIFDDCNLKSIERIKLAASLCNYANLPISCVYFDTDMNDIRRRNIETRTSDKQLTADELISLEEELEKPDPYNETWFDQLILVRG